MKGYQRIMHKAKVAAVAGLAALVGLTAGCRPYGEMEFIGYSDNLQARVAAARVRI